VIYGCAWKSSHLENKTDTEDSVRFGNQYSLWQCSRTEFQDKHIYVLSEGILRDHCLCQRKTINQSITANKKKNNTTSAALPVVVRLRLISHSRLLIRVLLLVDTDSVVTGFVIARLKGTT
jgi:hypothetical protein